MNEHICRICSFGIYLDQSIEYCSSNHYYHEDCLKILNYYPNYIEKCINCYRGPIKLLKNTENCLLCKRILPDIIKRCDDYGNICNDCIQSDFKKNISLCSKCNTIHLNYNLQCSFCSIILEENIQDNHECDYNFCKNCFLYTNLINIVCLECRENLKDFRSKYFNKCKLCLIDDPIGKCNESHGHCHECLTDHKFPYLLSNECCIQLFHNYNNSKN